MTRYLVDVYKIEIPDNGKRCDDLTEATEDWLGKLGRDQCYQFQTQGDNLQAVGMALHRAGERLLRGDVG
jgi:hypothetical protein